MTITALIAAVAVAAPNPGMLKTFRDWTVGCDNSRSCHATSLLPEDGNWDQVRTMSVQRGPAADATATILILQGQSDQNAKAQSLVADGVRLPVRLAPSSDGDRVDPGGTSAMLTALRTAKNITVQDGHGKVLGTISLAGASAALLYMDDVQRRVGTITALARPGPKPAIAVPVAPALPIVPSAASAAKNPVRVDAARIAALRKQHECEPENKDWPGYGVQQETLDANNSLILLGCGAGAYNMTDVPFIASRRDGRIEVEVAQFDVKMADGERGLPMLVNAGWASDDQVLTSFSKGRGIGDCGVGSDYGWDGARFRLVNRIEMRECRGSMDYITTWRAILVKRQH